jgi:hypothetical protein
MNDRVIAIHATLQKLWDVAKDPPLSTTMPALAHLCAGVLFNMADQHSARDLFVKHLDEIMDAIDEDPKVHPLRGLT